MRRAPRSSPLPAAAEGERPSKSQRKREMTALQALGESLLGLSEAERERIDLPERLREAIAETAKVGSREGRRRQLQFIGRLMRDVDAERLRAAIGDARGDSRRAVALMQRCERLRDRLLVDDAALAEVLDDLPGTDARQLRAIVRAARQERDRQQAPRHARALYRWLHGQLSQVQEAG